MWRTQTSLLLPVLACLLVSSPATAQKSRDYRRTYASDMEAFLAQVDEAYPFLDLKGLREGWPTTREDLSARTGGCKTDAEFMGLVFEGIGYLRDAHMVVTECAVKLPAREPSYYAGASFLPATDGRVVVMFGPSGQGASLKTGMVVLTIDGRDAREVLEERAQAAWEAGGSFSSPQRARLFEYRLALRGERGEKHTLEYLDGERKKKAKLTCRTEIDGWPHTYNLPEKLEQVGRSFFFTQLESGVGYMYLRRVDESVTEGIARALAEHPEARGWIVDVRGNAGGGYDQALLKQVEAVTRPVAVITDAGCISAGETLVRDFVRLTEARVFGATTAGSSTSKRSWAFPSGIATLRFSTRSRYGPDGAPIEFNGIAPHEALEAVPEELVDGHNSELLRAEAYLLTAER